MARAWGMKLGSWGRWVPFCEERSIVGLGWRTVDPRVLASGTLAEVKHHIGTSCLWYQGDTRSIGAAAGQLYRFVRECQEGDLVLYYDPPRKHVRITRIISAALFRDAADGGEDVDIWHCRKVEYPRPPIPISEFYGQLKGSLLGPKMSLWQLYDAEAAEALAAGTHPGVIAAPDLEVENGWATLKNLLLKRAESLTETDWEWLVVDYFKAQGAHVDERHVGGTQPTFDLEAVFDHGEFGRDVWRVQVKRQKSVVGWAAVENAVDQAGDAQVCYVSVFGFTPEAREKAEELGVRLLEASDFARFLMSGRIRAALAKKLAIPSLA